MLFKHFYIFFYLLRFYIVPRSLVQNYHNIVISASFGLFECFFLINIIILPSKKKITHCNLSKILHCCSSLFCHSISSFTGHSFWSFGLLKFFVGLSPSDRTSSGTKQAYHWRDPIEIVLLCNVMESKSLSLGIQHIGSRPGKLIEGLHGDDGIDDRRHKGSVGVGPQIILICWCCCMFISHKYK